jgi:hypothetical protein
MVYGINGTRYSFGSFPVDGNAASSVCREIRHGTGPGPVHRGQPPSTITLQSHFDWLFSSQQKWCDAVDDFAQAWAEHVGRGDATPEQEEDLKAKLQALMSVDGVDPGETFELVHRTTWADWVHGVAEACLSDPCLPWAQRFERLAKSLETLPEPLRSTGAIAAARRSSTQPHTQAPIPDRSSFVDALLALDDASIAPLQQAGEPVPTLRPITVTDLLARLHPRGLASHNEALARAFITQSQQHAPAYFALALHGLLVHLIRMGPQQGTVFESGDPATQTATQGQRAWLFDTVWLCAEAGLPPQQAHAHGLVIETLMVQSVYLTEPQRKERYAGLDSQLRKDIIAARVCIGHAEDPPIGPQVTTRRFVAPVLPRDVWRGVFSHLPRGDLDRHKTDLGKELSGVAVEVLSAAFRCAAVAERIAALLPVLAKDPNSRYMRDQIKSLAAKFGTENVGDEEKLRIIAKSKWPSKVTEMTRTWLRNPRLSTEAKHKGVAGTLGLLPPIWLSSAVCEVALESLAYAEDAADRRNFLDALLALDPAPVKPSSCWIPGYRESNGDWVAGYSCDDVLTLAALTPLLGSGKPRAATLMKVVSEYLHQAEQRTPGFRALAFYGLAMHVVCIEFQTRGHAGQVDGMPDLDDLARMVSCIHGFSGDWSKRERLVVVHGLLQQTHVLPTSLHSFWRRKLNADLDKLR